MNENTIRIRLPSGLALIAAVVLACLNVWSLSQAEIHFIRIAMAAAIGWLFFGLSALLLDAPGGVIAILVVIAGIGVWLNAMLFASAAATV